MEKAEVRGDGTTVWVNAGNGLCVGRFSWKGSEVHKSFQDQMEMGEQCLRCKAGPTSDTDWQEFRKMILTIYGIEVDDGLKPKLLQAA